MAGALSRGRQTGLALAHGDATQKPARETTSIEQSSNPSVMRVLLV
jgi:hypothetical protein